jgi:hypothetical protein
MMEEVYFSKHEQYCQQYKIVKVSRAIDIEYTRNFVNRHADAITSKVTAAKLAGFHRAIVEIDEVCKSFHYWHRGDKDMQILVRLMMQKYISEYTEDAMVESLDCISVPKFYFFRKCTGVRIELKWW